MKTLKKKSIVIDSAEQHGTQIFIIEYNFFCSCNLLLKPIHYECEV